MAALPNEPLRMTEEEYLAFERDALERHTYYHGQVLKIPYSTVQHSLINGAMIASLGNQVKDRDCKVLAIQMRLKVETSKFYTYPDINIVCGKALFADKEHYNLLNPTVIVEVISPHSEVHDRQIKLPAYRQMPSVREILVLRDDEVFVEHYKRLPNGHWELIDYKGLEAVVDLAAIGCTLLLEDVYEKVDLD